MCLSCMLHLQLTPFAYQSVECVWSPAFSYHPATIADRELVSHSPPVTSFRNGRKDKHWDPLEWVEGSQILQVK